MKSLIGKPSRWAVLLAATFLLAGSARAGILTIRDLTDSVAIEVTSPLFGTLLNSNCTAQENCSFSISSNTLGAAAPIVITFDFGSAVLREGSLQSAISDFLNCADCGQGAQFSFWQFSSDLETGLVPGTLFGPTNTIVENGTAQLALTISYRSGDAQGAVVGTDQIFIQSDVSEVPEPSAWMMTLSGLAVAGWALRRRAEA